MVNTGFDQTKMGPVFCVPHNKDLMAYWDRVEDRLYKIRNCMSLSGVRRSLALFAPPIDPALLVRATAAGLSIDEALALLNGPMPNYRFSYLIQQAKSFTNTVQSFGGALLSALEKKEAEELNLLRSVHERNILSLTQNLKKKQIEEARANLQGVLEAKQNVQNRVDYYRSLIEVGLISWEVTEQVATHASSIFHSIESTFLTLGVTFGLLPNPGSPFAMTYGGVQLEKGASRFADAMNALAKLSDSVARSAGMEGRNQRRRQEWEQQLQLAEQELLQMDQQILANEIRLAIAEKDLEIHKTQIEQAKELHDFYKDKFSNAGLYRKLSNTLQRLYRTAFNMAMEMAQKAEKAYQYETDHQEYFVQGEYWDSDKAGLLAGESLLLQLQQMETAFIENTPRRQEITQSFSLLQIAPQQLVTLRREGNCTFTIPEKWFNLLYPGDYYRKIKSVALTVPCVTGPYTNVSARLSLLSSKIRPEANLEPEALLAGPAFANGTISLSSGNNDGGQFELNFRDERFLPFEGGGAVDSQWSLELPDKLRAFDYNSISDVIFRISYTAEFGGSSFGEQVEDHLLSGQGLGEMELLLDLQQQLPNEMYRISQMAGGAQWPVSIHEKFFPYFTRMHTIVVTSITDALDNDQITVSPSSSEDIPGNPPIRVNIKLNQGVAGWPEGENVILLIKYKLE